MAPSKPDEPPFYYPLPPSSPNHPQNYVVLPIYIPAATAAAPPRRRILWAAAFLFLALAVYFLYPSDPDLKISRLRLDRIHVQTTPFIAVDVTSLTVSIGYRGKQLGFVTSDGGHVRPRGSSYVDATLELDGVISDVVLLVEDLARGSVRFDTVTEVRGRVGVFFLQLPLKVNLISS
ncbi:hypothetical protein RHMOL_Rhmol08G0295500 [Rhododendron molle]|uniref:Uncharacterized protein n=1 Tax=Rhododendron molle TaxID=49168 RepID=A0ACC0MVA3_RHOML|nr:hypothetical protein RHMOL_Rhmol08G0295500 [Rhododendron molle]